MTDCAIREVREETGLQIRITGLIGTYTDPHILIAYSDGEVRQEFTFVYVAEIESGELKIDDESKEATWMSPSSAVEMPFAESQRRRLKDIMEYQRERQFCRLFSTFLFGGQYGGHDKFRISTADGIFLWGASLFLDVILTGEDPAAAVKFGYRHRFDPGRTFFGYGGQYCL